MYLDQVEAQLDRTWKDNPGIQRSEQNSATGAFGQGEISSFAVKLPIDATTYYLIENRQPIGPDRNLPSHGVLIYYCDERIAECRYGKSPIKLVDAHPSGPELKGAPFTLGGKSMYKDEKRNISIRLVAQRGDNYEIYVSNGE